MASFGVDPWWLVVVKAALVVVFLLVFTVFNIWFERRVVARMQHRVGPNVHGPFGLLQSLADGIKLALKEDVVPTAADKVVFLAAPVLVSVPALLAFAVIPFGPEVGLPWTATRTPLQLTDLPIGVLFVLAMSATGIYGIVLGGWSSGSPFSLLGGLRSSAQMISYEAAMGLALVPVFLLAGSLSTSQMVAAQGELWFGATLLPSLVIYVVAMVGETNRAPFDLAEAEGELVGGYHTEYSSLRFLLFFLAEYVNMATVSALATTLFLGGWRAPWPLSQVGDGMLDRDYWPPLWFLAKVLALIFGFIWLRGTLPRLRYDQFMHLGWKRLIPASLVWLVVVAGVRAADADAAVQRRWLVGAGLVFAVLLVGWMLFPRRARTSASGLGTREPGYPVPALPGAAASWSVRGPRDRSRRSVSSIRHAGRRKDLA